MSMRGVCAVAGLVAGLWAGSLPITVLAVEAPAALASRVPQADKAKVAVMELDGPLAERHAGLGLGGKKSGVTLRETVEALEGAAASADLAGVVIKLKDVPLKAAQVEELGAAMKKVRASGKKVHVYAYAYDTPELILGSFADEVIVQAGSGVSLPGLYMEEMYLADTLAWVGVKADYVQIGDYKGADETMVNSKPSPAWNQNIDQLLDSMYSVIRGHIKAGRRLDDAQLDRAMETTWEALAEDARKAGLVDTVLDLPELERHLAAVYAKPIDWQEDLLAADSGPGMDKANPLAMFSMLMAKKEQKPKRPTIAVLHIDGPIIDGDSTAGGPLGGEASVGSLTIRRALNEIEENALVKGLVVRIDSPGGSAIASEVIWQGVRRVAAAGKPVWVSVGSMAASGGYYIAVSGQKIYVNPSSIVGSIGVVGGKLALGGLYEKLHVNTVSRARGPRAMMNASGKAWSEADRALVREKMKQTYDLFASRVKAGRPEIDLSATAEGRLFTGEKAISLKMADKLGGIETALDDMATDLKLVDGTYDVMDYPAPRTFEEMLEDLFGRFGGGAASSAPLGLADGQTLPGVAMVEALAGPSASASIRDSARALLQLRREPVLLLSPRVLVFR